ncbi:MAG: serine/threonine-protein kinase, partial [Planctomycetota bacterium]
MNQQSMLGPFRLGTELGSGGMGTVHLAEDRNGRKLAIKIVHPHLLKTPGFFKRFLREAEIGKQVRHENIVRTLDVDAGEFRGEIAHYLVMEYVHGQTLRQMLEETRPLPESLCRHIALQVAHALAAIHRAGVIHRDLKPENVLITDDHVLKVMDLGVARLVDEALHLSESGAFLGSIRYAAPEQWAAGTDLDGRADLYSLGVMLYELCGGRHPNPQTGAQPP